MSIDLENIEHSDVNKFSSKINKAANAQRILSNIKYVPEKQGFEQWSMHPCSLCLSDSVTSQTTYIFIIRSALKELEVLAKT